MSKPTISRSHTPYSSISYYIHCLCLHPLLNFIPHPLTLPSLILHSYFPLSKTLLFSSHPTTPTKFYFSPPCPSPLLYYTPIFHFLKHYSFPPPHTSYIQLSFKMFGETKIVETLNLTDNR